MNRLDSKQRAQVVAALVEGNSIRATVRMTGVAKNTIAKLLIELGAACSDYLNKTLVNLNSKRIQCDEIWSFIKAKQKNVTPKLAEKQIAGDVWTWVAMDADSKLVCSWLVGKRDAGCATEFIQDLADRLAHRVQLTTDGHRVYLNAVIDAFADDIDYAMLVKMFGADHAGEARYSPANCTGCREVALLGKPNPQSRDDQQAETDRPMRARVAGEDFPTEAEQQQQRRPRRALGKKERRRGGGGCH